MSETHVPVADATFLDQLADVLLESLAAGAQGCLVHAVPDRDGHRVGILPLEGRAPADALLGTVVPDEWMVLGVANTGWTRPLDDFGHAGPREDRIQSVVLVHRCGDVVARLRRNGETEVLTGTPSYGAVLDCIQRALGLPSAPPLVPTGHFFAATWLESVVATQHQRSRPLTWREMAQLHPACRLLDSDEGGFQGELVVPAKALERVCDWERIRWMVVEGTYSIAGLSPTDAAWFDDGSFSRWVMGQQMPLPALLDEICRLTRSSMAERCARALRKLGILSRGQWRPPAP